MTSNGDGFRSSWLPSVDSSSHAADGSYSVRSKRAFCDSARVAFGSAHERPQTVADVRSEVGLSIGAVIPSRSSDAQRPGGELHMLRFGHVNPGSLSFLSSGGSRLEIDPSEKHQVVPVHVPRFGDC
jgi:hypothetical protein